jgi:hypothetical protein
MAEPAKPEVTEEAKMDLLEDDDEFEEFEIDQGTVAASNPPPPFSYCCRSPRCAGSRSGRWRRCPLVGSG